MGGCYEQELVRFGVLVRPGERPPACGEVGNGLSWGGELCSCAEDG